MDARHRRQAALLAIGALAAMPFGVGCSKSGRSGDVGGAPSSGLEDQQAPKSNASALPSAVAVAEGHEAGASDGEALKLRQELWHEIRPVALKNCTLGRIGSTYDGGYAMCTNLIQGVQSLYSYGIAEEDNWGCQLSSRYGLPVHQYDCFTDVRPNCGTGRFLFHAECVGDRTESRDGKPFDTIQNQIAKNGDTNKRLILKMDVEGAEIESLLATPDSVLDRIEQLPMELHGFRGNINQPRFLEVVKKLKRTFYIVSLHFNNYGYKPTSEPSPSAPLPVAVFQLLLVNKRVAVLDPNKPLRAPGSPPDSPDDPKSPDCQPSAWPD